MSNPPVPDRRTRSGIAVVAGARAHGWQLIGEVLDVPGPRLVERLRSGELVAQFRAATDWLGDDAGRFLGSLMALEVYTRRADRRSMEQDLADLRVEYARVLPDGPPPVVDAAQRMARRCESEAQAWEAGDHELAKRHRQEQFEAVETELVDTLPAWCARLAEEADLALYRNAARLLSSYLSVESGRDIDRFASGD